MTHFRYHTSQLFKAPQRRGAAQQGIGKTLEDNRPMQRHAGVTMNQGLAQSPAPIQRMQWTYTDGKWVPEDWGAVDYATQPSGDKPEGTTYEDTTQDYTFASIHEDKKEDKSPAGLERAQRIAPYLALMGHLAGEQSGRSLPKGGHLLWAMESLWGDALVLINPDDKDDNAVWHASFKINNKIKAGGSTMFPASWSTDDLEEQLNAATDIGGKLYLQPSNIKIRRAGDTFYPDE
jgi:hypothetical protein